MARQKKKRAPKKTLKSKKPKKPEITEFGEYKLKQVVYTKLFASDDIGYGPISSFHPKDSHGPAFTFYDQANGGFRTSLIENIIESPEKKVKNRIKRKKDRNNVF